MLGGEPDSRFQARGFRTLAENKYKKKWEGGGKAKEKKGKRIWARGVKPELGVHGHQNPCEERWARRVQARKGRSLSPSLCGWDLGCSAICMEAGPRGITPCPFNPQHTECHHPFSPQPLTMKGGNTHDEPEDPQNQ